MNGFLNFLAAVGNIVATGMAITGWKEDLRVRILRWNSQNPQIVFQSIGVKLLDACQTPNGVVLLIGVFGLTTYGQIIPLSEEEAPLEIGEAISVVYNGYPVDEPQELFTQRELYAQN